MFGIICCSYSLGIFASGFYTLNPQEYDGISWKRVQSGFSTGQLVYLATVYLTGVASIVTAFVYEHMTQQKAAMAPPAVHGEQVRDISQVNDFAKFNIWPPNI